MTAEIAVLNTSAVALAADSAVSSPVAGQPIYNTANKIFALSLIHPVGVMVYGSAQVNGVPWETVLKMYRTELGHRGFARLTEYRADLLRFLQRSPRLFSLFSQERYVRDELWWEFDALRRTADARVCCIENPS